VAYERIEPAMAALFARLQNDAALAADVTTFSRAYRLPTELQAEQQPALILTLSEAIPWNPAGGRTPWQSGHPLTLLVTCLVLIYSQQDPDDPNPDAKMVSFAAHVERILRFDPALETQAPQDREHSSLDQLVIRIGNAEKDATAFVPGSGTLQQSTTLIPLEFLVSDESPP
jgi:hypothetical protein